MILAFDDNINTLANKKMDDIKYYSQYLDSIYTNNFIHDKSDLLEVLTDYIYSINQLKDVVNYSITNDIYIEN